jgi:EF-P beta-lysylation protein EpmB
MYIERKTNSSAEFDLSAGNSVVSWQQSLASCVSSLSELADILQLPQLVEGDGKLVSNMNFSSFPLRVPREFVARMKKGSLDDPLLQQVLPQALQSQAPFPSPGFSADPLKEKNATPVPGLLHKFKDRVLLIVSGACAIHCRYCFRQHFPYAQHVLSPSRWQPALDYIRQQTQIKEVIISGGDPLSAKDSSLSALLSELCTVPHLRRLRIHTRMPIVIPQRIDTSFLQMLRQLSLPLTLVVHSNHPQEIDGAVIQAMHKLNSIPRLTLLNQTVLLHGINCDAQILAALSERLHQAGVLPYYLHRLDKVSGAEHFALPLAEAQSIMWQLLEILPGFLVPKLVEERPGLPSKLPLDLGPCPWL